MIEITDKPISPELVVSMVKTDSSGCITTYIGLIRQHSRGKQVVSAEYKDSKGEAEDKLREIASKAKEKWHLNNIAIFHRLGKLKVGDINLVIAVASAHRKEGFAACRYAIDQFKQIIPTQKREIYHDGSFWVEGE